MENNIILYTTPDGHVNVQVQFEDGTFCPSCRILHFVLSIHSPDVAASICVEADLEVPHELSFYDRAFIQ